MIDINIAIGRFQPFTKGHLQMLIDGKKKNGLPTVILMIQNTVMDARHPFSDDLIRKELEIIQKNHPGLIEDIILVKSADIVKIGKVLSDNGYSAHLLLCGEDREASYKKMIDRYGEKSGYPADFATYTGSGRTEGVSGTSAREAIKNMDEKGFDKIMPRGTDSLLKDFNIEMSKLEESDRYKKLSDFLAEENVSEAIVSKGKFDNYISRSKKLLRPRFKPRTNEELILEISETIKEFGSECSLNHIDVSEIVYMNNLFDRALLREFNGDISQWDTSNVIDATGMFLFTNYTGENGDISNWNVSNIKHGSFMFKNSKFDGDLSKWEFSPDAKPISFQMFFAGAPISKKRKHWPKMFR